MYTFDTVIRQVQRKALEPVATLSGVEGTFEPGIPEGVDAVHMRWLLHTGIGAVEQGVHQGVTQQLPGGGGKPFPGCRAVADRYHLCRRIGRAGLLAGETAQRKVGSLPPLSIRKVGKVLRLLQERGITALAPATEQDLDAFSAHRDQ